MTIKELESKLQKIDPNLEIIKDSYMKSEVLVMKPNLLAVKGQYFIYDFFNKKFIRNGILKWLNDNDTFAFDKMQSLLDKQRPFLPRLQSRFKEHRFTSQGDRKWITVSIALKYVSLKNMA